MVSTGDSVRHRVLRHSLAKIKSPPPKLGFPPLKPGEMQLYSYFTPALSTGLYDIVAEQTILPSGSQPKTIQAPAQSFRIDAPRFSIDPALIHSTFPHQGVAAQANILPHIVFNDPHLPWQTEIGETSQDASRIPWLAVVAFEQSELKLPPDHSLPPQSSTMATRLSVAKLTGSGLQFAFPDLSKEDPSLPSKTVDVIFPKMDLFLALFGSHTNGAPPKIDLDRFKYLAHARHVNTTHMTDSGVLDEGQFSIVFSHRTGPPFQQGAPAQPKRCVAHLVSLDWIHRIPVSALTSRKHVALISLFSWTYDCIPLGTVNFEDVMKTVGQNSGLYRTPDEMRSKMSNNRMKDRLGDGYTLVRYRVQTGEESVALMRGPLTPYANPDTAWMDVHSNTGEDLKIIDSELGIIDISYCAAWQLGKSLAIADQAFSAALFRIRTDVCDTSRKKAKEEVLSQNIKPITSERVINSLSQHFADMKQLSKKEPTRQRWDRPSLIRSSYQHLANKDPNSVESHLQHRVEQLASATDGIHHTELKDPISTDWDLVLNWILDKLYLERIPPWYLILDPTWLPPESIRFFHIDRKWLSALVDGALSVANHLDVQDKVRRAFKNQLLKYLNEEIHPDLKHPPQIPSYGFYLRSVLVDALPDLVVRAPWPALKGKEDPRAEILRQENVRKDIMSCLLDHVPEQLILSQPPHQQCFMFGHNSTFTTDSFELELRKVYSVPTGKRMDDLPKESFSKGLDGRCEIYDWNTRTILIDKFIELISSTLYGAHMQDSDIYDGEVNASLVGIELNRPAYRLAFISGQPPGASLADIMFSVAEVAFPNILPGALPVFHSLVAATSGSSSPAEAATASGTSAKAATMSSSSIGVAAAAAKTPPEKNYPRAFKGPRNVVHGPPRRLGFRTPTLVTPQPAKLQRRESTSMSSSISQFSIAPEIPSISPRIDYDGMEECSSRFSAICFPIGCPSTAKDYEPKYLIPSPNGSEVIVRLARNQSDPNSTDRIRTFEIRIPFGTTVRSLLTKPLNKDAVQMLNTVRFMVDVGVHQNETVIHLKPKAASGLSLLSHNPDMSFMIKRASINPETSDSTISIVEMYTSQQDETKIAINHIRNIQVIRNE